MIQETRGWREDVKQSVAQRSKEFAVIYFFANSNGYKHHAAAGDEREIRVFRRSYYARAGNLKSVC